MEKENILFNKILNTKTTLNTLIRKYQSDRVSFLTQQELLSKDLLEIKNIVKTMNNNKNTSIKTDKFILKDDFYSIYLSKEFEELKNNTTQNIKIELEKRFNQELIKHKKNNKLLMISSLTLSCLCIILSTFIILK